MRLDVDFARAQFPAFSEKALAERAFFENAGGSYACRQVIDRLNRFYRQRKVQPYGPYDASRRGGEEVDEARTRLSAVLGVDPGEVSFGPSTTQNTYVLSRAFGSVLDARHAIVVTDQDHEANIGPWLRLADRGVEVRTWKVDPDTGHLPLSALENLLDGRVRLVCFSHCSNIVGEINPVAAICGMCRDAGAWTCVDGVSYAPHGLPDIEQLGADIYLFSTYKTYGPHQGVMVVRRRLAETLPNEGHYFNAGAPTLRFNPAGPDHAQVAATAGIVDYLDALFDRHAEFQYAAARKRGAYVAGLMRERETRLLQPLLDQLARKRSARLIGPADARLKAPTVAVALDLPGRDAARLLADRGIMAGGGDFYAVRCLEALGLSPEHGVLRVSFVHYTHEREMDLLQEALDEIL